ncbi:MAG: DUF1059 domain-containing protein [Patescibacteria group bacterium]
MYSLACKDMGHMECPFVAEGETQEETMKKLADHAMQAHGMTEADMMPEMKDKAMSMMKEM